MVRSSVVGSLAAALLCSGVAEAHTPMVDISDILCDYGYWQTQVECKIDSHIAKTRDTCYHYVEKHVTESTWNKLEANWVKIEEQFEELLAEENVANVRKIFSGKFFNDAPLSDATPNRFLKLSEYSGTQKVLLINGLNTREYTLVEMCEETVAEWELQLTQGNKYVDTDEIDDYRQLFMDLADMTSYKANTHDHKYEVAEREDKGQGGVNFGVIAVIVLILLPICIGIVCCCRKSKNNKKKEEAQVETKTETKTVKTVTTTNVQMAPAMGVPMQQPAPVMMQPMHQMPAPMMQAPMHQNPAPQMMVPGPMAGPPPGQMGMPPPGAYPPPPGGYPPQGAPVSYNYQQ